MGKILNRLRDPSAKQVKKPSLTEMTTEEFVNCALKNTKTPDVGSMILQFSSQSILYLSNNIEKFRN
jgi:hypothetical protein